MPTEHEYKYVLSLDFVKEFDEATLFDTSQRVAFIDQGYVGVAEGTATRIRRLRAVDPQKYRNSDFDHWILTFKQQVGARVVEIETEVDRRDGEDLWSVCTRRVCKVRYYFPANDKTWELDLFKTENDHIYFVLAEVELPEGSSRPTDMPEFLRKYVIYEVGLTDSRFSNKKLGDVRYTTDLYQRIKQGVIDDDES